MKTNVQITIYYETDVILNNHEKIILTLRMLKLSSKIEIKSNSKSSFDTIINIALLLKNKTVTVILPNIVLNTILFHCMLILIGCF